MPPSQNFSSTDTQVSMDARQKRPSLTLVLPAYNEQATIEQAIREADAALAGLTDDYEILVVDDGSTDRTADLVAEAARRRGAVRLLRQPGNLGYGAALRRGFQAATKQLVAFTDADCQFDVRQLDRMILLAADYDIVCGYRIDRQDAWNRKVYSAGYNLLARLLLGTAVRDCDCALKLFRREWVQSVEIESDGFFVNSELLTKARLQGASMVEVGVAHRPRPGGESKVSLRHVPPVAAALARFWWRELLFPPTNFKATAASWSRGRQWAAGALLGLICLLLLLANLSYPLLEPDESRYAQIALEMLDSGDWITPRLDGQSYLDKPPLLYWMTALSYRLFGANEAAARLPCALCAALTVLLCYGLGKRLIGARAAWCGALALLLCGGFVLSGRFLILDGPLTLFVTAALLMGYLACGASRFRLGWWLAAAAACGLGVLAKGPVAVVLVLPPLVALRFLTPDVCRVRPYQWMLAAAVVVALTAPWFLAVSAAHGDFSGYFFWKHHVLRFVSAFDHRQPWWFYLPVLFVGMFPASLLLPALALFLFGRGSEERRMRAPPQGFLLLAAAWVLGFFSISSCKLPTYILPALPPLALLLGVMLDATVLTRGLSPRVSRLLRPIPRRGAVALLGIAAVGAAVDWAFVSEGPRGWLLDLLVLVAAGALLPAARRWTRAGADFAWGGSALVAIAVLAFAFVDVLPGVSRMRSIHLDAARLHAAHRDAPVVYFGHNAHSAALHLERDELVRLRTTQSAALRRLMREHREAVLVASRDDLARARRALGDSVELTPAGGRGRVFLMRRQKAPAVQFSARPQSTLRY